MTPSVEIAFDLLDPFPVLVFREPGGEYCRIFAGQLRDGTSELIKAHDLCCKGLGQLLMLDRCSELE